MRYIFLIFTLFVFSFAQLSKSGNSVIDKENKLMWQDTKDNVTLAFTHTQSEKYCNELVLGGFTNWRLPTMQEYKNILDLTRDDEIMIDKFVTALDFECKDYMRLSITTTKLLKPYANIALFNKYRQKNSKAENAYIWILFEYEKVEDIKDFLEEQGDNEFVKYRALLELRNYNHHFKLIL